MAEMVHPHLNHTKGRNYMSKLVSDLEVLFSTSCTDTRLQASLHEEEMRQLEAVSIHLS